MSWNSRDLLGVVLSMATGQCCGGHSLHHGGAWQELEPVGSQRERWALRVGGGAEKR